MKEAIHHKNDINGFSEKLLAWGNQAILVQKIIHLFNSASVLGFFIFILCSERGLEVHENCVNGFSRRSSCLGQIGHILSSEIIHPNNSNSLE